MTMLDLKMAFTKANGLVALSVGQRPTGKCDEITIKNQ